MRWLLALVFCLMSGAASACYDNFSKLDDASPVLEATLGIRLTGASIKASSMNDRCWEVLHTDDALLRDLWLGTPLPERLTRVLWVTGARIEPDYATYPDAQDAYEHGRHTPLKTDLLRLSVLPDSGANREALREAFGKRNTDSEAGRAGRVENTAGTARINDMDVELFTSRVEGGWSGGDTIQSAAVFAAPSHHGTLIVLLGDTNFETDRKAGIRIEETFHQALRQIEPVAASPERCPFDFDQVAGLNKQMTRLGIVLDDDPVPASTMTGPCWGDSATDDDMAALIAGGGAPEGVATLLEVAAHGPDGTDTGLYALKISLAPWAVYEQNRPALIEGGLLRPVSGTKDKVEHRHEQVTANGIGMDVYTAYVDAPFLTSDSYASGVVFQAPARPDLAVMIRGNQHEGWDRIEGALIEATLHALIEGMAPAKP